VLSPGCCTCAHTGLFAPPVRAELASEATPRELCCETRGPQSSVRIHTHEQCQITEQTSMSVGMGFLLSLARCE
jgi:hypothetical protein